METKWIMNDKAGSAVGAFAFAWITINAWIGLRNATMVYSFLAFQHAGRHTGIRDRMNILVPAFSCVIAAF